MSRTARRPLLLVALFVIGCGPEPQYELPVMDTRVSWFPPTTPTLQLARGDSAKLLLAVRDSAGDTLGVARLPFGHLMFETRDPPIVAVETESRDTLLALFRVHVRADRFGTDTLRIAWLTTICGQRTSLLGPRTCYAAAWFAPLDVPVLVHTR